MSSSLVSGFCVASVCGECRFGGAAFESEGPAFTERKGLECQEDDAGRGTCSRLLFTRTSVWGVGGWTCILEKVLENIIWNLFQ